MGPADSRARLAEQYGSAARAGRAARSHGVTPLQWYSRCGKVVTCPGIPLRCPRRRSRTGCACGRRAASPAGVRRDEGARPAKPARDRPPSEQRSHVFRDESLYVRLGSAASAPGGTATFVERRVARECRHDRWRYPGSPSASLEIERDASPGVADDVDRGNRTARRRRDALVRRVMIDGPSPGAARSFSTRLLPGSSRSTAAR